MNDKKTLSSEQRRALLSSPAGWIACGFGAGLTVWAQGTFGSLAALLPWLWLRHLWMPFYIAVVVIAFAVGVWACGVGGRAVGVDDHRSLVWDEFVGQWVALTPLMLPTLVPSLWSLRWLVLAGFVLFRLFDVWKPWPIRWMDRHLKGGMGVMVDDVVAGIFAAVVLALGIVLFR